jgi:hypothetical protein
VKHGTHVNEGPNGAQRVKGSKPPSDANHGEGNPEAAEHFNKAEQEFVASKRGQQKIREAGNVSPEEEAELDEAERIARSPPMNANHKVVPPKDGKR